MCCTCVCSEISQETAVNPVDIVSTLQSLQMLKYWKGKHLVLKRQVSVPLHEGVCHDNIYIGLTLYTLIPCTGSKMGVLVTDKRLNWSAMAVQ